MARADVMLSKYGVFSLTLLPFPNNDVKNPLTRRKILGKVHNRTSVSPQASGVHTLLNTQYCKFPENKKGALDSAPFVLIG
jgi:hypothetical protein